MASTSRDLDSRNGTLVNGQPVKEQACATATRSPIGDSVFLFLTEDDADQAGTSRAVEFDDEKPTHATAQIRPQDVLYLQPEKILQRTAGHLAAWRAT